MEFVPPPSTEAKVKATLPIYSRHFLLTSPSPLNLGTDKLANSIDGNYNGRHCRGRFDLYLQHGLVPFLVLTPTPLLFPRQFL